MSQPKVGFHAFIRERAIPRYVGFYGALDPDEVFIVHHIDGARGRGCVYLKREGGEADEERLIPVWRGDVKAVTRCDHCDVEGHTYTRCPKLKKENVDEAR